MDGIGGSCILSIYSSVIQLLGDDCTEQVEQNTPTNPHPSANTFSRTTASMKQQQPLKQCTEKERFMSLNSFSKLGLCAPLADALGKLSITDPTEIQTKTIPH